MDRSDDYHVDFYCALNGKTLKSGDLCPSAVVAWYNARHDEIRTMFPEGLVLCTKGSPAITPRGVSYLEDTKDFRVFFKFDKKDGEWNDETRNIAMEMILDPDDDGNHLLELNGEEFLVSGEDNLGDNDRVPLFSEEKKPRQKITVKFVDGSILVVDKDFKEIICSDSETCSDKITITSLDGSTKKMVGFSINQMRPFTDEEKKILEEDGEDISGLP